MKTNKSISLIKDIVINNEKFKFKLRQLCEEDGGGFFAYIPEHPAIWCCHAQRKKAILKLIRRLLTAKEAAKRYSVSPEWLEDCHGPRPPTITLNCGKVFYDIVDTDAWFDLVMKKSPLSPLGESYFCAIQELGGDIKEHLGDDWWRRKFPLSECVYTALVRAYLRGRYLAGSFNTWVDD